MPTIIIRILAIFGGIFNRIRGGADIWYKSEVPFNKVWLSFFLAIITWNPLVAVANYIGHQIAGWGAYLGSLTTGCKPAKECKAIDWLCKPFEWCPRLWGFVAMTFRGLLWTLPLAIVMWDVRMIALGLGMPLCYALATCIIYPTKYNNTKAAWNLGEFFWGFVLTVGVLQC